MSKPKLNEIDALIQLARCGPSDAADGLKAHIYALKTQGLINEANVGNGHRELVVTATGMSAATAALRARKATKEAA